MKHFVPFKNLVSLLGLLLVVTPISAFASSQDLVACPDKNLAKVDLYTSAAETSGIKIDAYEAVNRFQGWGKNEISKGSLKFVRVQVPGVEDTKNKTLYIFEGALATTPVCETRRGDKDPGDSASTTYDNAEDDETPDTDEPIQPAIVTSSNGVGGLTNANCCGFPLETRPHSFLGGIGKFGSRRWVKPPRGKRFIRVHGGSDLYGERGQDVFAIEDGEVIRGVHGFTKGPTYDLQIRHKGGFVVRYGEITAKNLGLRIGSKVKKGEKIAEMNHVPGAVSPMIHIELYKGTASGDLSSTGGPMAKYMRRSDLTEATAYLRRWGHI